MAATYVKIGGSDLQNLALISENKNAVFDRPLVTNIIIQLNINEKCIWINNHFDIVYYNPKPKNYKSLVQSKYRIENWRALKWKGRPKMIQLARVKNDMKSWKHMIIDMNEWKKNKMYISYLIKSLVLLFLLCISIR